MSTSNEVMETVSSDEEDEEGGQFLPFLRQGPMLELGVTTGALVTTPGLGAAVGEDGLEDGLDDEEQEGELELLSRTQVLLLTVSLAPTL